MDQGMGSAQAGDFGNQKKQERVGGDVEGHA